VKGILPAVVKARPRGLVPVCRDANVLNAVVTEVEKIDSSLAILAVPTDISSATSVNQLMLRINEKFGHVDVLVNNTDPDLSMGPVVAINAEMWWREFETNGSGAYLITQAFVNQLSPSSRGTIINLTIGSASGIYYRHRGQRFAEQLSRELRGFETLKDKRVTSVSLHPGVVSKNTDLASFETREKSLLRLVGGTTVWLCSGRAWLHGRWIAANWDVAKMCEVKHVILERGLLKIEIGTSAEQD
jgi:NAD(P)-dependent dehydrogenase (short-subunit alcohol dehydrogenase family)